MIRNKLEKQKRLTSQPQLKLRLLTERLKGGAEEQSALPAKEEIIQVRKENYFLLIRNRAMGICSADEQTCDIMENFCLSASAYRERNRKKSLITGKGK